MLDLLIPFVDPFNSRPHKEVDNDIMNIQPLRNLSTHDLTRRSTH